MSAAWTSATQLNRCDRGVVSAEIEQANSALFALRQQHAVTRETTSPASGWLSALQSVARNTSHSEPPATSPEPQPLTELTVSTDLLLAFLRSESANEARVWLLCRAIDAAGSGSVSLDTLSAQLTDKASQLRICGRRRLRQILAAGEGRFWTRDKSRRLWLKSQRNVAVTFGLTRATFVHVTLPLNVLTGSLAACKANFYAALHSARADETGSASPISRASLTDLTGVSERTQQRYDNTVVQRKQQAIAVGERYSDEALVARAWQGKQCFKFVDYKGSVGAQGESYVAWSLPNQYQALHQAASKVSKRRFNKQLKQLRMLATTCTHSSTTSRQPAYGRSDLATTRAQGNGPVRMAKRYVTRGNEIASAEADCYFRNTSSGFWCCMTG